MKKILINTNSDGLAPTITVRYAQGFALSSALYKSGILGRGGAHQRLAIIEIHDTDERRSDIQR